MKNLSRMLVLALGVALPTFLAAQKSKIKEQFKYQAYTQTSEDGKYTWMGVSGDPLNARMYVLKNGLTVYMTANRNEPRIQTYIAVRTGSTNDPKDATGLAHYLEHLLFKGTDKYGSLDYAKEKPLLDKIEALYEEYRATKDEAKRKEIYKQIDAVSNEAAKFAIAGEFDKMLSAIGAKGTNAYTSFEQTVYVNDIPSNQIEKWLRVEGERFRNPVLRLFHTELEAVYEEKNISIDSDGREAMFKMLEGVFPTHNYGQQTTIGTIEHLKNPSIKKIKEYFAAYYVPNNMAICLSGDLDPDATIRLVDKYFGAYQSKPVTAYQGTQEKPITSPKVFEVKGPEAEFVYVAYRNPAASSRDALVLEVIDYLLSNSAAGLIDLNLVKQQKVLQASSSRWQMRDYGVHYFYGRPNQGQTLEQVKDLLIGEAEKIKKGNFDTTLLEAVINDMEISKMRQYEQNRSRASEFVEAFILGMDWSDYIRRTDDMRSVTVKEIKEVATKYLGTNNYVVVYKRTGERPVLAKVVKPEITPVPVNRDAQSDFLKEIVAMPTPAIQPRFIDYDKDIQKTTLASQTPVHYVRNEENSLFTLYYLFDFGTNQDKMMPFAVNYLPFLGTDKYTAEQISQKFYALGTTFRVQTGEDQLYVYVSGLQKNFDQSIELFEHLLANAKADKAALAQFVEAQLKSRADAKLNKNQILWRAMIAYGTFGQRNPFNDQLSEDDLRTLVADELVAMIHGLTSYKHRVLYYGPAAIGEVTASLDKYHAAPPTFKPVPTGVPYEYVKVEKPKVYFVNYDMVQAEILWLSRDIPYDPQLTTAVRMYNEYFGGSMSSIVFQTIRESKALAYSTFSAFVTPRNANEPFVVQAYVGTQADKVHEAIAGMNELLNGVIRSDNLFEGSKASVKNKIETERITRTNILFDYETAMRRGVARDLRQDVYQGLATTTFATVENFHKQHIAGKQYNLLILGSKDKVDLGSLSKYGEVVELSLKDLFGY